MIKVGMLVNNVEHSDYNYGMVLETKISITDELIEAGAPLDLAELESSCSGFEPPGSALTARVFGFNLAPWC